jgi:hypothetical protein
MPWFRRGLVAIAVCAGALVYAVLSWSAFPRNLVGVGILVLIGAPLALAGEALAELAPGGKARSPIVRVVASIGLGLLLLTVWWVLISDTGHVRNIFMQASDAPNIVGSIL